jgi:polyphosphate kinase
MTRNLDRRVEQAVPVLDPRLRARVRELLDQSLRDNCKARRILPDGGYEPVAPAAGEEPFDSQEFLRSRARQQTAESGADSDDPGLRERA